MSTGPRDVNVPYPPPTSSSSFPPWLDSMLFGLIPSFLQPYFGGDQPRSSGNIHKFAALDGLRGWACLLVFNFHFLFTYTYKTSIGWGLGEGNWGIHQLPIIHLLFSGHVMVAIFFVISGYVLSYKTLKLLRDRSWEQAFHTIASATFRRAFRLYIPSIIGIFFVLIAVFLGCYNYSHWVRFQGKTILGTDEQHPPIFLTFSGQLIDWYFTVAELMNVWNWSLYYNYYNPHLWTIPVEFRSSIVLFLTMLATSRLRTWCRLATVAGLTLYCMLWGRWDVVLFLSGMIMAEIDIICGLWDAPHLPNSSAQTIDEEEKETRSLNWNGSDLEKWAPSSLSLSPTSRPIFGQTMWLCIFVIGLYFGSCPNTSPAMTPGFRFLSIFTPRTYPEKQRFLQSIGAVTIVCCINRSSYLQRAFTHPVAQYLGRISFAFYIVHGPILHSLGYSIMPNIWKYTGRETDLGFCFGLFIGYSICLPVSIWAGDLFWRTVDVPTVKFSRWLEKQVTVDII